MAYLSHGRKFATIQEYLNVVRILHLELGHKNPVADNFELQSMLRGVKRQKGNKQSFKLAITTDNLKSMHATLNMQSVEDVQLWCAILVCFYGLLRISAVCVKSKEHVSDNVLCRRDLTISSEGCSIQQRHSKTNQYGERSHCIVLPYIRGHILCPVAAMLTFLGRAGAVPPNCPLLTRQSTTGLVPLTQDVMRRRLTSMLRDIGLDTNEYGTHSLRRGGATWLMTCGVPLHTIKSIGDWKSDCVQKYLKPNLNEKFKLLSNVVTKLK